MTLLEVNNLALGYDGTTFIENINFKVNQGDYLFIIGDNGAGKSTLLKTLLNLHKPNKGKIVFQKKIKSVDMGYLPQQKDIQKDFPAAVKEIVLSGFINNGRISPFYSKTEKMLANTNMEKLGIAHIANKSYKKLSGGLQQRVLLARAICSTNKIILLDEPVAGLDPESTKGMYQLITKLNVEDKISVIMVSHDIDAAIKYGSHILKLGKDYNFYGTKNEYLQLLHDQSVSKCNCKSQQGGKK